MDDSAYDTDQLSQALVREYLARRGCRSTLASFDEEIPRTEDTISSRSVMARAMHLEKVVKYFKEQQKRGGPQLTILEMIATFLGAQKGPVSISVLTGKSGSSLSHAGVDNSGNDNATSAVRRSSSGFEASMVPSTAMDDDDVGQKPRGGNQDRQNSSRNSHINSNNINALGSGKKLEPIGRHQDQRDVNVDNNRKSSSAIRSSASMPAQSRGDPLVGRRSGWGIGDGSNDGRDNDRNINKNNNNKKNGDIVGGMAIEDVAEEESSFGSLTHAASAPPAARLPSTGDTFAFHVSHHAIGLSLASDLRKVVFGGEAASARFPEAFMQGIYTRKCHEPSDQGGSLGMGPGGRGGSCKSLAFGIWQEKGGPCGVLASVQAELIRQLIAPTEASGKRAKNKKKREAASGPWGINLESAAAAGPSSSSGDDDPESSIREAVFGASETDITAALYAALATILWRCGNEQRAVVALPDPSRAGSLRTSAYRPDGLTETLSIYEFDSIVSLRRFLVSSGSVITAENTPGIPLLIYSAILSRGVDLVKRDFDSHGESSMIGKHGYCTQELVNLLLTGRASSNVFDGSRDAGGLSLGGIESRSGVGFLTLFEHYGHMEVGSFMKKPEVPVWVVQSESHYSVLFAADESVVTSNPKKRFNLYYYDELARQDEEIKLSIDTSGRGKNSANEEHHDITPPLDLVIRTAWPNASVNWNGTELLL